MVEVSKSLVCELPAGLVLSDSDWQLVVEHWRAGGCKLLSAEVVSKLVSAAPNAWDQRAAKEKV